MTNYTPNAWAAGDIITETKMDRLEAAVASHTHAAIDIVAGAAVTLTDGATVATNAALGSYFRLTAAGNRTLSIPTNPADGMEATWEHIASGGARTLSLTTGSSGAFAFGTTITALSATSSGLRDIITCIYSSSAARWLVVRYVKGY